MNLLHVDSPASTWAWREVLAADPAAAITQTPDWLACLCRVGPYHDASRLYMFDDGRRILVPLARRGRRTDSVAREESWPFDWGIGGPLADGPIKADHARAVYTDLADRRLLRLTIRPALLTDPAWHTAVPDVYRRIPHSSQVLDLDGGFASVWHDRFSSSTRQAVRKAERSGLHVEVDDTGRLLDVFYELYQQSIVRWARDQHEPLPLARIRASWANPRRKFQAVSTELGTRCAVWVAWHAGEPAAALIVLRHGDHAKYWRGAMNLPLAGPSRATQLLHRLAIEDACQTGARRYHLGDSRPGSGLARFKAGFGAQAYPSPAYRVERLPLTEWDAQLRGVTKRILRFRDA